MAKNTSILLTPYYEKLIAKGVKSGEYSSASEVVREALRLWAERVEKKKALKKAIQQGLDSGISENFTFDSFIDKMKNETK
jgi:antitoxin ParD1/3/4